MSARRSRRSRAARAGACSAGGDYTDADGNSQAFLVNEDERHVVQRHRSARHVDPQQGRNGARSTRCRAVVDGSCGVQGSYADASQNNQLFVVNSSVIAPTTVSSAPRHVTAIDKKGVITVRWTRPGDQRRRGHHVLHRRVAARRPRPASRRRRRARSRDLNKKVRYAFEVRADQQGRSQRALGEVQHRARELSRPRVAPRLPARS